MKLNTKRTILVGFAFCLICLFWSVYDSVISKMLINSFGMNQLWSGVVMSIDNVLALFMLPLFGVWSDRTKTKWGKRTPYIFLGTVIAAVVLIVIGLVDFYQQVAVVNAGITGITFDDTLQRFVFGGGDALGYVLKEDAAAARQALIWANVTAVNPGFLVAFICILLIVLVAMASFRTPAVSLMPDVTPKPLRSKGNAIINLMGTVGGSIALVFMTFTAKDYESYILTFIVTAILMIVMLVVFITTVKEIKWVRDMHDESLKYGIEDKVEVKEELEGKAEKMPKDVQKSFLLILAAIILWFFGYNAATTKFSVYAGDVLNIGYTIPLLVAQVAALIAFIPIGFVGTKIGRRKTILIGICVLTAAFILGIFVTANTAVLMYVVMAMAGIGWATINVNSYPMVVEMSRGSNIGKYTGYYYTASMAAQIATPIISGALMDINIHILFPYCAVFCALAFIPMFFVKHGDSKPVPTTKLEALGGADD